MKVPSALTSVMGLFEGWVWRLESVERNTSLRIFFYLLCGNSYFEMTKNRNTEKVRLKFYQNTIISFCSSIFHGKSSLINLMDKKVILLRLYTL